MPRPLAVSLPLLAVAACVMIALATRDTTAAELTLGRGAGPSASGDRPADLAPVEPRAPRLSAEARVPVAAGDPRPRHARVRLHGSVVRNGAPVPGFDLSFVNAARREADWDFTDAEGAFEVWVAPGAYEVRRDEAGPRVERVVVPGLAGEQRLELALPPR